MFADCIDCGRRMVPTSPPSPLPPSPPLPPASPPLPPASSVPRPPPLPPASPPLTPATPVIQIEPWTSSGGSSFLQVTVTTPGDAMFTTLKLALETDGVINDAAAV
eukprot:4541092-Prymnesium_polylepis.3